MSIFDDPLQSGQLFGFFPEFREHCLSAQTNPSEEMEEAKEKPKGMRRETQGKEALTIYTA
jgi:hypothetical protein